MKRLQLVLILLLLGCEHKAAKATEPVLAGAETPQAEGAGADRAIKAPPRAGGDQDTKSVVDANCVQVPKLPSQPPVILTGKSLVLTKILKPCVTPAGERGVERSSPYLAMGFPCTGGSGRIEIKGHYNNPNLIVFVLGTDCTMSPSTREIAQSTIAQAYELPATMKLAAYTPFVVQYWEVAGVSDADVGYVIELRKAPAVEGLWRRFQQNEKIQVRLYGRENTWAQGDNFYAVEGTLKMTGRTAFQLEVTKVKSLSKDEVAQVRTRCEALRPKRNCTEVF
ncbi:MAG: hypothetical protein FJ146_08260 [Deltaproteobacteria bacterium]|nr:hypothetical protein [Deltaproteobacteria bacterium]